MQFVFQQRNVQLGGLLLVEAALDAVVHESHEAGCDDHAGGCQIGPMPTCICIYTYTYAIRGVIIHTLRCRW